MINDKVLKKYIDKDRSGELEIIGVGSEKLCFSAGANKVLLRYKRKVGELPGFKEKMENEHIARKELTQHLQAHVPQTIDFAITPSSYYYELQERAKGKCIAYYSEEETMLKVFGKDFLKTPYEALSQAQRDYLGQQVYHYDRYMQKQLKDNANTKHIQNFLQDYKKLCNLGHQIDNHSENIFFDVNAGFTFVDINYESYDYIRNKNDDEIMAEIFTILNCFHKYIPLMTPAQAMMIDKDVAYIKLKCVKLANSAGFKLSDDFVNRVTTKLDSIINVKKKVSVYGV